MTDKEHKVHFDEDADTFGKDNEIMVQSAGDGVFSAHLGFLQIGHRYEITLTVTKSLCTFTEGTELRESTKTPNLHCRVCKISYDEKNVTFQLELLAHKEKLLKEELCLECSDGSLLNFVVMARVLGRGKGTPLLRNGIKCIAVELEDESEASDWQGFD